MFHEAVDAIHHHIAYPLITSGSAKTDREVAHERALNVLEIVDNVPPARWMLSKLTHYDDPILYNEVFGLPFQNPTGIAAGLDKNARIFRALAAMGPGMVEVGTMSFLKYSGNPKPRLFHLLEDLGYINRMSFPGDGTDEGSGRLENKYIDIAFRNYIVGGNFGASKPSFEQGLAIEHYFQAFVAIAPYVDYLVGNISSPNTEGVKQLIDQLEELLSQFDEVRQIRRIPPSIYYDRYLRQRKLPPNTYTKPFLLKLSPDLTEKKIEETVEIAKKHKVDGFIATNTTVDPEIRASLKSEHKNEIGGISGAKLREKALRFMTTLTEIAGPERPVIAAGGLANAEHHWNAFSFGRAYLGQSLSGFVEDKTSSPYFFHDIKSDLAEAMRMVGFRNMNELIGSKEPYPFKK